MGLILKQVKNDSRWFVNSLQRGFLREEMLLSAINAARLEWADRIRWPELKATLTASADDTSVSVSSLVILDIVALYYGGTDESHRLLPYDREGKDVLLNTDESVTISTGSELRPTGYFWNMASNIFEFLYYDGSFTVPENTQVTLYYHGLPSLYTTQAGQDDQVLEIPTQYCYHIKYYVASYYYQSKDNYKAADTQYKRWDMALLRAEMLFNKSKRDFPKRVKDGMAYARRRYIDTF